MNLLRNTTQLNQYLLEPYLNKESIAVDATCGNGNDTLFLAERCKEVVAFDIQEVAIENTKRRVEELGYKNVRLVHDSFVTMNQYVTEADVIMFNLGYLPEGDKSITTSVDSTLEALNTALELVKVDGCVSVMLYWGHEAGKIERDAVLKFTDGLNSKKFHTVYVSMPNQKKCPPEIVLITKKK